LSPGEPVRPAQLVGFVLYRLPTALVDLPATMLIAVKASHSEICDGVPAAITLWLFVFDCRPRGSCFREQTLAIAATGVLLPDKPFSNPSCVFAVQSHAADFCAWQLKKS
jgi:hypothetical protein